MLYFYAAPSLCDRGMHPKCVTVSTIFHHSLCEFNQIYNFGASWDKYEQLVKCSVQKVEFMTRPNMVKNLQ